MLDKSILVQKGSSATVGDAETVRSFAHGVGERHDSSHCESRCGHDVHPISLVDARSPPENGGESAQGRGGPENDKCLHNAS